MTEPTDRSTPRTSSTKVMPIAMTATCVACVTMLRKLAKVRKRSERAPNATSRTAKSRNGAKRRKIRAILWRSTRISASAPSIPQRGAHQRFALKMRPVMKAANLAAAHDHDPVGHADQLLDLGGDEQHGRALADQLVDDLVDFILGPDVDAARRLVENEDRRSAQQPFGDHHLLLIAARKRTHGHLVERAGVNMHLFRHFLGQTAELARMKCRNGLACSGSDGS